MNMNNDVVLKKFNTYFQFMSARKQFLILDAYSRLGDKKKES